MMTKLDPNDVQTFYKAIDSYIDAVSKAGRQDILNGLYDMFMDNDYGSDIDKMLAAMDESKNLSLQEQFKRIGGKL